MIQWFKKHPEFLRSESQLLSHDSNYQEIHQARNILFLSHGNIIVRLNKVYKFPTLFIYTDATPYKLPLVFPTKEELSADYIDHLSKLKLSEALEKIYSNILFYYNLRHQNSSGSLCILEDENLNNGSQYFSITDIIKRVRDWNAGHLTKRYPPDSEEVDYIGHFSFICHEIKLIIPDFFIDLQLMEGQCFASLFKIIPQGVFFKNEKRIFFGVFIDGINQKGIIVQPNINLRFSLFDERIKTSFDIITKTDIINKLIAEQKIFKAFWFHVEKEPKPFHTVSQLVEIIGNGSFENGISRMSQRCIDSFKTIPEYFYIGLRFPNRRNNLEFQFFKLIKASNPPTYNFSLVPVEKMKSILDQFDIVEAIEGEKLSESTYYQRNSLRADHDILIKYFINFLGVGALGSEIADCMTKAGVGAIELFDNQTLKLQNAIRHLAGMDHYGEPKVSSVADILFNHNPFIAISTKTLNLFELDPPNHLTENSLSISSVADDNLEGYINQQLVISNNVAFYVRALRGGKSARIIRVIPGKDACFHCLSLYSKENSEFINIPEDLNYPTLRNECNNPIRPASASDLKLIASITARIVIDYLQTGDTSQNNWIWSTEVIQGTIITEPFKLYSQFIKPHKDCLYCHDNIRKYEIKINQVSIDKIKAYSKEDSEVETGGVLAGYYDANNNIIVLNVSGPGPNAVRTASRFEKDIDFCQNFLNELYINSNKKIVYVGEWHSHTSKRNLPSNTDLDSLTKISLQENYLTEFPIMIIISNDERFSCTVHPMNQKYYYTELTTL